MSDTFEWWGQTLRYADYDYNRTRLNERAVELPIASEWLRPGLRTLEVGNVLAHYVLGPPERRIVDRYEQAEYVDNFDVFEIEGEYEQIVSLPTIEHVRWDEEPKIVGAALGAVEHLCSLLVPGGRMLLSIPTGWNPPLDRSLAERDMGTTRACTFVRDGDGWRQTPEVEIHPYAATTPWAEAVWIGEWIA